MPKAERGTPKDIANRIKAKGLQKLKFYCQMCQKQCRDQNGFQCHLTSESHLRQMKLFSENAHGILDQLSKEFEQVYLQTLRQRHGTQRVNANNVYQEVIRDRHHIHMNATKWTTLTDFMQYLGKTGKCVVDETERGWYVQYIERDATLLARQEAMERRLEAERLAEMTQAQRMEIQRREAAKAFDGATTSNAVATDWNRNDEENDKAKIVVAMKTNNMKLNQKRKRMIDTSMWNHKNDEDKEEDDDPPVDDEQGKGSFTITAATTASTIPNAPTSTSRRQYDNDNVTSTFTQAEFTKSSHKKKKHDDDWMENWLHEGIIVRIITKKLANGIYYKRKALVRRVLEDGFTAEVQVLKDDPSLVGGSNSSSGGGDNDGSGDGDVLRLDQEDVETVVPKKVSEDDTTMIVRIVNGPGRGQRARILSLDKKHYMATLEIIYEEEDGGTSTTRLDHVGYENFSVMGNR